MNKSILPKELRKTFSILARKIHVEGWSFSQFNPEMARKFEGLGGTTGSRYVYKIPASYINAKEPYVVKFAKPRQHKIFNDTQVERDISDGLLQNWREYLLSQYDPARPFIVPVHDIHPKGMWIIMPFATMEIEDEQEKKRRILQRVEEFKKLDVECVMGFNKSRDVEWLENWGWYNGKYNLIDFGGVVLQDIEPVEIPDEFTDPYWDV